MSAVLPEPETLGTQGIPFSLTRGLHAAQETTAFPFVLEKAQAACSVSSILGQSVLPIHIRREDYTGEGNGNAM